MRDALWIQLGELFKTCQPHKVALVGAGYRRKRTLRIRARSLGFGFSSGNLSVVFASAWTRGMAERGVFETDIGNF